MDNRHIEPETHRVERSKDPHYLQLKRKALSMLPAVTMRGLVVLLVLATILFVASTRIFDISNIEVRAVDKPSLQYIEQWELQSFISALYLSSNYFTLDIVDAKDVSKDFSPFISEVYIEKLFPNGVQISIREREPGFLVSRSDVCTLISLDNTLLVEVTLQEEQDDDLEKEYSPCDDLSQIYSVPLVVMKNQYSDSFAEKGFYLFEEIISTLDVLAEHGLQVVSIELNSNFATFNTLNEKKIHINLYDDHETQMRRVVLVLRQIDIERIEYREIDVRYNRPISR